MAKLHMYDYIIPFYKKNVNTSLLPVKEHSIVQYLGTYKHLKKMPSNYCTVPTNGSYVANYSDLCHS